MTDLQLGLIGTVGPLLLTLLLIGILRLPPRWIPQPKPPPPPDDPRIYEL